MILFDTNNNEITIAPSSDAITDLARYSQAITKVLVHELLRNGDPHVYSFKEGSIHKWHHIVKGRGIVNVWGGVVKKVHIYVMKHMTLLAFSRKLSLTPGQDL